MCECKFKCRLCNVCTDMYSCTCSVHVDKMLPCKHIHIAMMQRQNKDNFSHSEIEHSIPDNTSPYESAHSPQIPDNEPQYIVENSNLFELKKLLVINNINELNEDSEHILDKILILCKTNDFKPKISEINSKKINIDHQLDFKPKTKLKKLSTPSPQYFACLNYSTNIADKNLLWCPSSVIYLALNSKVL